MKWAALPLVLVLVLAGCGSSASHTHGAGIPRALLAGARPIGRGPRFQPPARGAVVGRCARGLGPRFGVHVEVFAMDRVVIIPAGIGTRPPRRRTEGRISDAACYGDLVTLEPTGVVLVRPGARVSLAELFRAWGQPLSARRIASFSAAPESAIAVSIDGRRWSGGPGSVPLTRHREIVLEVGPHVPPHSAYTFPPGT